MNFLPQLPMSSKRSLPTPGLLLALALPALLLAGCGAKQQARNPRVPVTIATAVIRPMPLELLSTGTIEPVQTASVGSQVGGVVTRVAFREGDEVRAGQVLFELDPRPFRIVAQQAAAALARDRAQAETARLEADRARKLMAQDVISRAEWDQKRAAAEAALATVRADSAVLGSARLNVHYAAIRAPIAGRTGRLMVHVGDLVKAATSDPLVVIHQVRPVRVGFTVPENAVPLVQRYRSQHPSVVVRPSADDSLEMRGALVFVDNAVDPSSGTLMLKGELPNADGRLVPGEFVTVRLVLTVEPNATVVPAQAVTTGQQGTYVYVMNADSTVTPRPVSVGRTQDELAIVTGGLKPGEHVVTDGQFRLSPGARVVVRRAAAERT